MSGSQSQAQKRQSAAKLGKFDDFFIPADEEDLVGDLPNVKARICELLNIPSWSKAATAQYLSEYQGWHKFLQHIDTYPVMEPGNPILIGAFSIVRDQQARLEGAFVDLPKRHSPRHLPPRGERFLIPHRKIPLSRQAP